ncbi:MAG TPA: MarR family winged helix-turn-helix transcriptional regulator [Thermomicrobiales bacterium]|jgi:DNA-binding MarR family transcriptional regulator
MEDQPVLVPMLGALLRAPVRAISARIAADLAAAGYGDLRPAHLAVFQHLPAAGARSTALAERAQMTKQSMGALIDYLAERGYVERVPEPTDQRARVVCRTARGWAVERAARESLERLEGEWGAYLGADRMREFRAALTDLGTLLNR